MPPIRFPKPLLPGDAIAVTAPSSGVRNALHPRLDVILNHLRTLGFRVIEGHCLREELKGVSAPTAERLDELTRFLHAPEVNAIFPPWGGELAIDLLEKLDFDRLANQSPKWVLGFSDVSTLLLPLTLRAGWATAHGHPLMDLSPRQTDALSSQVLTTLAHATSEPWRQVSSQAYQLEYADYTAQPDAPFQLTEPTRWTRLDGKSEALELEGRLVGGCLDCLLHLGGSEYGDVPSFIAANEREGTGTILFLENCELKPFEVARALHGLRLKGWFRGLSGVLLGRNSAPDPEGDDSFKYRDAVEQALGACDCPVLLDCDIGHRPPQLTLILGARARVAWSSAGAMLDQWFEHTD